MQLCLSVFLPSSVWLSVSVSLSLTPYPSVSPNSFIPGPFEMETAIPNDPARQMLFINYICILPHPMHFIRSRGDPLVARRSKCHVSAGKANFIAPLLTAEQVTPMNQSLQCYIRLTVYSTVRPCTLPP